VQELKKQTSAAQEISDTALSEVDYTGAT